jgi:FixJ family two-component response regulator
VSKKLPVIAVVDDEEPIRKALARLLQSAGLTVETFASGADFLQSLTIRRPDCVVLDLHMPRTSGFEVQAALAQRELTLPVVIITGYDTAETHERATAGRHVAYLRKPMNDQALLDAIDLALSSRS